MVEKHHVRYMGRTPGTTTWRLRTNVMQSWRTLYLLLENEGRCLMSSVGIGVNQDRAETESSNNQLQQFGHQDDYVWQAARVRHVEHGSTKAIHKSIIEKFISNNTWAEAAVRSLRYLCKQLEDDSNCYCYYVNHVRFIWLLIQVSTFSNFFLHQ